MKFVNGKFRNIKIPQDDKGPTAAQPTEPSVKEDSAESPKDEQEGSLAAVPAAFTSKGNAVISDTENSGRSNSAEIVVSSAPVPEVLANSSGIFRDTENVGNSSSAEDHTSSAPAPDDSANSTEIGPLLN